MEQQIHKVEYAREFRVCPACGYEDGFHTMLRRSANCVDFLLICPACHNIFDVGQTLPNNS